MNSVRLFSFLVLCIGIRSILAFLPLLLSSHGMAYFLLRLCIGAIGLGFMVIYLFGLRKTGLETGGARIWWNSLRPIHALLYLSASVLLYFGHTREASVILLLDVFIGLVAFLHHHKKYIASLCSWKKLNRKLFNLFYHFYRRGKWHASCVFHVRVIEIGIWLRCVAYLPCWSIYPVYNTRVKWVHRKERVTYYPK